MKEQEWFVDNCEYDKGFARNHYRRWRHHIDILYRLGMVVNTVNDINFSEFYEFCLDNGFCTYLYFDHDTKEPMRCVQVKK